MITIPKQTVRLVRDGKGTKGPEKLDDPEHAKRVFQTLLADLPHEELHIIAIDARHRPIMTCMVGRGGAESLGILSADIFRPLIVAGARGFFIAHNHPSGDPTPSSADVEITRQLRQDGDTLQITLLDHIVIADGAAPFSMFQNGVL